MGSLVGGALGLVGGIMGANAQEDAAQTSANAQMEAARIAAEESRFRPVAITTGFGQSQFQTDPQGRVTGAGYQLTPELQALRNQLISQATGTGAGLTQQGLGAAQGLFNLGQQYVAKTPEQAAADWMASQQQALNPAREQALSGLMNRLAQQGTQGLAVSQAGGAQANPLAQAYFNAIAQQDRELAARAQEQGRAQTQFGTGLFSDALKIAQGGYGPLSTQLAQAQGVEQLGQGALDLSTAIGQRVTTANTNAGNLLAQGQMNAARTLADVQGYSPFADTLMGFASNPAAINSIAGLFSGGSTAAASPYNLSSGYSSGLGLQAPVQSSMFTGGGFNPSYSLI